jgi:ankyrin repeat protein
MAGRLIEAIKAADAKRARALVTEQPELAHERDENGVSALMLTRYYGLPDDVTAAIRGERGELDVFEAATLGETDRLRALLEQDPSLATAWSSDRGTALHFAAFFTQLPAARLLLERGADVHAVSPTFGEVTALHSAAAGGSAEIVHVLLEAGADANARQQGAFTALHAAAQNGDAEMVRDLLAHGADQRAVTDEGRTPLSFAEEQGHDDVAALLRDVA